MNWRRLLRLPEPGPSAAMLRQMIINQREVIANQRAEIIALKRRDEGMANRIRALERREELRQEHLVPPVPDRRKP